MRHWITLTLLAAVIGALSMPSSAQSREPMSPVELQVIAELNSARTDPARYATYLAEMARHFRGKIYAPPHGGQLETTEGMVAVDDAIRFLRAVRPLPALVPSPGLALAARDQVNDQGRSGKIGHQGADGSLPADRLSRYGTWLGSMGENISYGVAAPRDIVIQLIIDDGVQGRGHRMNIFNPQFHLVGVAVGRHSAYNSMCVIDFAGGFTAR